MLFQVYFFQSFYQDRKSTNLEKAVNKFKALYSLDIHNSSTLYKALGYFEVKNNAKIAIYSTNGNVQYISDQEGANSENVKLINQIFNNLYQNKSYTEALIKSDKSTITTVDNTQYSIKHIVCLTPFSLN
jgi:transcription termination factor NusB